VKELAAAEKINASCVSRVLRLTLLAPDIVEAILDEWQPAAMTLAGLMRPLVMGWERQVGDLPPLVPANDPPFDVRYPSAASFNGLTCRRRANA
jgi:hypothetical protein